ncbi:Adhesion G protein-coupled receptor F5 [Liparis tanakae]|uniref:Adhesion G protein-coupled receptor F5 n=1 Tax=Liparis tanakae TaxID=230148 RepID=A0A4Z2J4Q4_9TELE|nr:Adhesion G protein-coupled receptor F5 [Liparis tanakae]
MCPAGLYECGFTKGSIRHTAKASVKVILLPDEITMKIDPLSVDCTQKAPTDVIPVTVTATILKTPEHYEVVWTYFDVLESIPFNISNDPFCMEESDLVGDYWPKSPSGDTVLNTTCAEGRVGYKSRTCEGTTWQPVFYYCVNEQLDKINDEAFNFLKGLNATQDMANAIFLGLQNNSLVESDQSDYMADINSSINTLNLMDRASEYFDMQPGVLPDLMIAASNMLNVSWAAVNQTVVHDMSANYLESVEGLVDKIHVNKTAENIMDNNDSSLEVNTQFPKEKMNFTKPHCVFWNVTMRDWSDEGCAIVKSANVNQTFCQCEHLTSFSVLFAKEDISTEILDIITYVGLGVSICCLVVFLTIEYLVWGAVVKSNLSLYRHTSIVNIATFLLLGDISFLASEDGIGETMCFALTSSAPDSSKGGDKEAIKGMIKVVIFLTPVFGLTWIIGFALLILDSNNPMFAVANYGFTILNSFQGLFLLITGVFADKKVRDEVLKLIMAKTGNDGTVTSTTNTKDK